MATVVRMPQLGESVVEGTILRWLKQPGDPIVKNEPLLVISTDKIDTEVPAPADGVLLEVRAEEGATVSAGSVIATIGEPGEQPQRPAEKETPAEPKHPGQSPDAGRSPALSPQAEDRPAGRNFISPVVARMERCL